MSDRLPCPHCGAMFTDLWDYAWDSDELIITECGECEKPVDIIRRVDVTYMLEPGMPEPCSTSAPHGSK